MDFTRLSFCSSKSAASWAAFNAADWDFKDNLPGQGNFWGQGTPVFWVMGSWEKTEGVPPAGSSDRSRSWDHPGHRPPWPPPSCFRPWRRGFFKPWLLLIPSEMISAKGGRAPTRRFGLSQTLRQEDISGNKQKKNF